MAKRGLYANIHAKRKRIAAGSKEKMRKPGTKGAPTKANFKRAAKTAKKKLTPVIRKQDNMKVQEWYKKNLDLICKNKFRSGAGMTRAGVASYRRKNPGSKLKTAVTGKVKKGSKAAANRRKSYCARSAGQMKQFPKAAAKRNSRLRQARKRWKC